MKMSRTEFLVLLAITVCALGYVRQAGAEEHKGELKVAKTILISFEEALSKQEADKVLEKAGLDPKKFMHMSWGEAARQMSFRGEATAEQTEQVSQALLKAKAKANACAMEYVAGNVIAGFKAGTTIAQAEAFLRAQGYRQWDPPLDLEEQGLIIAIKGLPRGKEWETIEKLRKHEVVTSAELNGIAHAMSAR